MPLPTQLAVAVVVPVVLVEMVELHLATMLAEPAVQELRLLLLAHLSQEAVAVVEEEIVEAEQQPQVVAMEEQLVLPEAQIPEAVEAVVAETQTAQQVAQVSSSLPTHNSSHLWHLLMQV
jgi:hypothetical protein